MTSGRKINAQHRYRHVVNKERYGDVRHWTALRTAGFKGSENLECIVLASWRSLSMAWK